MYFNSIIITTLVLLLPMSTYSQIRDVSSVRDRTIHEYPSWSVELTSSEGDDFPSVGFAAPVNQSLGDQTAGTTIDTTRGQLTIHSGFLKSTKFSTGSEERHKVHGFWGSYTDEFKGVLGHHPAALEEAERASVWNAVSIAAWITNIVIQTNYIVGASNSDADFSRDEVSYPLGPVLGTVAIATFASIMKSGHLKKSVRMYNEFEAGSEHAASLTNPVGTKSQAIDNATYRPEETTSQSNRLESWYTNWGLGYAGIGYPSNTESALNSLAAQDGVSHAAVSLDFLSFYLRRGEHTLLGGGINAFGDAYSVDGESFSVGGSTIGLSAMHFLTDRIGKGFFLRADAGPAQIRVKSSSGLGSVDHSESGFGFLVGGGYGVPVSPGTRLLLNANYASRSIEGETYSTFNLSVSGLF